VEKVIFRETDGFGHTLRIIICDRAWWRTIDGEYQEQGKAILLLEISEEEIALMLNQAPTHEAVCKIVDAMLEVELYNDLYEFSYGRRKAEALGSHVTRCIKDCNVSALAIPYGKEPRVAPKTLRCSDPMNKIGSLNRVNRTSEGRKSPLHGFPKAPEAL